MAVLSRMAWRARVSAGCGGGGVWGGEGMKKKKIDEGKKNKDKISIK